MSDITFEQFLNFIRAMELGEEVEEGE